MGAVLVKIARRFGPLVARQVYKRWKAMSPEEKERYRRQMRTYADRGRSAVTSARDRRRGMGPDGGGPSGGAPPADPRP